jgi:hypothetical protein
LSRLRLVVNTRGRRNVLDEEKNDRKTNDRDGEAYDEDAVE